ncbi:hypothetical protein [Streptomyces griseorubiginosus]|uniref:hypothetical protein n=1 Tax=Streptomyces griseorubiginosus TaxID=67304 RepID=UPI00076DB592|nr:hypothetical protein [Streptomyces griseorubiginosus]KUM68472.1 hypothetical protein AQI84_38610 [Streptomyces griseorubiginosus]
MTQKLSAVFPPNPATLRRVADWLSDHPGATVDAIAEGVMPGKVTGPVQITEVLRALAGQCRARRDGERWYPAG